MERVIIQTESCKSCLYCVKFCPKHVLDVGTDMNAKGYPYIVVKHAEQCISCGICGIVCPEAAIEVYKE